MKKVGFIALLLFAAFVVTGFLLPKHVRVERSVTVDQPATMMFAILNSFQHFNEWSPWAANDEGAEFTVSGPDAGVGATLSWVGDPRLAGTGSLEIVTSEPFEYIQMQLDRDFQGLATSGFRLQAMGDSTRITWAFDSDLTEGLGMFDGFIARYVGLLFERWVGTDYQKGLASLKQFAESMPASDFRQIEISRVDVEPQLILFVSTQSSQDSADVAAALSAAYYEISEFMNANGVHMNGQPMAITRAWEEGGYQFDAAIPVDFVPDLLPDNIQAGRSPSGPGIKAIHVGRLDQVMPTYEKLAAYMSAHGLSEGRVSWEHYVTDPASTEAAETITHIYIMLDE